jgi:hypothetical protein
VQGARDPVFGLRAAKADLVGVARFERVDDTLRQASGLTEAMWRRRELENDLARPAALERWARTQGGRLAGRQREPASVAGLRHEDARHLRCAGGRI